MLACLFAGCSIGFESYEEILEKYDITAQVTYYANGGYFSQSTSILSMEVEFTSGSKFFNVSEGSGVQYVNRTNYDLLGWYYVQQVTLTEENDDGEEEEVLYFVLDVTDEDVEQFKHTAADGSVSYYFEYTSELSTGSEDEDDEDDEEFDEDAEIDLSNLTNRMYYVKADTDVWLMSQEDYDYYVRLRKQNSDDSTINVPDLKLGDEVDTSMTLEDGTHLYVVADWTKSVSINYVLAMKSGESATSISVTTSGTTKTVSVGETIYSEYFGTSSSISRSDAEGFPSSVTLNDATVLAFYYDAECTQPVNGANIDKPEEDEDGNTQDVTIYAQCVSGVWEVLRTASDVRSMFNGGSDNYYLLKDIDCSEVTISPMSAFSGIINGNGYTISNLNVSKTNLSSNSSTALFGIIRKGAEIYGLTIDTVNITYTTRAVQFVNIYLLGMSATGTAAGDFDISGLIIKNVTMNITLATYSTSTTGYTIINNIQYINGVYESDNWLYGIRDTYNTDSGVNDTDAEFIATYGGADVQDAVIYITAGEGGTPVKVAEI